MEREFEFVKKVEDTVQGTALFIGRLASTTWVLATRPSRAIDLLEHEEVEQVYSRPFTYVAVASLAATLAFRDLLNPWLSQEQLEPVIMEEISFSSMAWSVLPMVLLIVLASFAVGLLLFRGDTQRAFRFVKGGCYSAGFQFFLFAIAYHVYFFGSSEANILPSQLQFVAQAGQYVGISLCVFAVVASARVLWLTLGAVRAGGGVTLRWFSPLLWSLFVLMAAGQTYLGLTGAVLPRWFDRMQLERFRVALEVVHFSRSGNRLELVLLLRNHGDRTYSLQRQAGWAALEPYVSGEQERLYLEKPFLFDTNERERPVLLIRPKEVVIWELTASLYDQDEDKLQRRESYRLTMNLYSVFINDTFDVEIESGPFKATEY